MCLSCKTPKQILQKVEFVPLETPSPLVVNLAFLVQGSSQVSSDSCKINI